MYSTYGFEDLSVVISHKAMGQLTLQGAGVGTITFAKSNDVSTHDVAADGSVMTSKIKVRNGTVAITVQQTSDAHSWFTKLFNYLESAPTREWTGTSLMATSSDMKVTHECSYMSPQKQPDKAYQQQGQQITWTFLAADMKEY
jgi:hypothetical protein